jgi:predicted exporter
MGTRGRLGLALAWLALLLVAGWWIGGRLRVTGDLREFMPAPRTPAQKLLIEEMGEGPGSRLLLVALSSADPATLARQSRALRARLAASPRFAMAENGGGGLDAIPERLRPYRYLLSDTLDHAPLDAAALRDALQSRVEDLGSPAAALIEPLVASDPTLETLKLAEAWQPPAAPQRMYGVWFDRAGRQALLLAQTRAPGFDPDGQQAALDALHAAFAAVSAGTQSRMDATGPGPFSVEVASRTRREAGWIGTVDTISLVLLLWFAYRSWKAPLLGVLPLASAGLAGLAAVASLFDGVHGITIAFGFTLIGVVQDYPIHLFSHQRAGLAPREGARLLWPTLATGVVSTCIAYVTFLASGVGGLQQLAVFTIGGLATAALATRFLLPSLLDPVPARDAADSRALARLWTRIERLPRPRAAALAVFAAAAVAIVGFAPGATWQNDLSKLAPVPAEALRRDAQLRGELGAPDVRYVVALQAPDAEGALRRAEGLRPVLDALVQRGAISGYDSAARYLPSAAVQRARQAALPDEATLRAALAQALAGSPFRPDAFEPFVADVAAARRAPPLTARDLAGTPLAAGVGGQLLEREGPATARVSLSGLAQPGEVARTVRANGAQLLDLKQASESLVVAYRDRVLFALALAAVLLAATVWIALRSRRRALRVLVPMALSTLLVLAVLRGCGVELNLFHLVALVLGAGLGLDYALFFEHAGEDRGEQLRTLHAVIVCSLTTLLVFMLLALSSIPVLRAIGSTVALGVVANFAFALLLAREPASPVPPAATARPGRAA